MRLAASCVMDCAGRSYVNSLPCDMHVRAEQVLNKANIQHRVQSTGFHSVCRGCGRLAAGARCALLARGIALNAIDTITAEHATAPAIHPHGGRTIRAAEAPSG